ncbi:BZ3500_MvSof-1268-A1-R1_Chr2-1g04246 [Microbotryum saponariae]|uniref:BZ3500_MvSof-1268-A1-R1_Chr2-1g04246 protein n=1 Tax=Microbotryum saponariae TaxID=289078 RepID=A0A2X0KA46_9BASI|nr:BZ3500_MvSof-1268-A1-R1_Chr2-1g04246 [Microbotryum saponariae]SCZ91233.1 BZ3501_MvSof-1269-A2-R1_Chr2-1g03902 [Microbotryum saponariae]
MSPRSISTRRPPDFVKKLYFALEAARQTHEPDLRWVSPGEFEITGDQKRALEVLQRYQLDFKLFSSFVRQLSYYKKPGVKENIHFGHPARDFWTGNAGKAFAVMIRKSRKRKDRASVTSNCSTSYSHSPDDGALSSAHSGDSNRRDSVASIDSHGGHSTNSDYITHQTSLAAYSQFPSNAQKPSFINLNAPVHEQAVSTLPVYPSPLSPSATTPYWTHEHSPLAQGSPYATLPAGSDRMPPGENVFSHTFGAATRGMTAPMSSYYYPNEGKHASSSNHQAVAYYPSQHERYMAVDAARWGQVDSQSSLSSAALPTPPDYYLPPYNRQSSTSPGCSSGLVHAGHYLPHAQLATSTHYDPN